MCRMHHSASFSAVLRVHLEDVPGTFGRLAAAIGEAGGLLDAIDLVRVEGGEKVRDVTVLADNAEHMDAIAGAVRAVPGIWLEHVSDRTFLMHLGGKIEVTPKTPVKTRDDLSMAYTPGVARVSSAIAEDEAKVWTLTIKANTVAVVTDGTAVLGLGDVGPEAALPVMEGKAMLFKEFAGIDAFPICLDTTDPDGIVAAVKAIAPVFGGTNLEDIAAPRCFEVEERLQGMLDIPVFHDDQHGTAVVVLAALENALKLTGRLMETTRVVISGAGAAGVAVTKILLAAGVKDVAVVDTRGVLHSGRDNLNEVKRALAVETADVTGRSGTLGDVLAGADVLIGVSGGVIDEALVATMADDAIIFGLANPTPEVLPDVARRHARVVATGRSDFPNQINNVLAFPGIFRGAFDARARSITEGMKLAAAGALADLVGDDLSEELVIPSPFDERVGPAVAAAVAEAARRDGVARA